MRWIFWFLMVVNLVVFVVVLLQKQVVTESEAPVQHPAIQNDVKALELLPEVAKVADVAPAESMSVQTAVMNEADAMCTLVGPFDALLHAEYLVENARALGVEGEVSQVETPGDTTYWVHLPPELSRKAALRRLHELQSKGIDSYVIPKGELENGISFGMFSKKTLADNLLASLQAQGYDVELREVVKVHAETWVVFSAQDAALLDDNTWLNLLKGAPEVERRQNFCSTVAPG